MNSNEKYSHDTATDEYTVKILTAISVVSKRLARNIAAVRQQGTDKTRSFKHVADKGHSQP